MSKFKSILVASYLLVPMLVSAQDTLETGLETIQDLLNLVVPIVITLAVIYFFYGLAKYILASGDEDAKNTGRRIMLGGIIALFVMVSVWGLVNLLGDTFGVDTDPFPDDVDFIPTS